MKITTPTTTTPIPTPTISLRTNGIIGFLNLNHSPQYNHLFPRTIVPPNTINYYCYYYASLSPSPLLANILSPFLSLSLSLSLSPSHSHHSDPPLPPFQVFQVLILRTIVKETDFKKKKKLIFSCFFQFFFDIADLGIASFFVLDAMMG